MKRFIIFLCLILVAVTFCGCGETLSGVGKDVNRMGKGVNTFFFRQP
jgi:predicted small secreted protein